jgi:hypothetical protein
MIIIMVIIMIIIESKKNVIYIYIRSISLFHYLHI